MPTEIAKAIATVGFDACSTASNHSFDRGFPGLKATLDALDAAHVKYSGTARTQAEAERPVIVTGSNGLKLGLVSGTYGLNGSTPPKSTSWAWSDIEADHLIKRAEAAKKAGADIVIVADVYAAGEQPIPGADRDGLVEGLRTRGHRQVLALPNAEALPSMIHDLAQPGDFVVCLGAGNITAWANALPGELDRLNGVDAKKTAGGGRA